VIPAETAPCSSAGRFGWKGWAGTPGETPNVLGCSATATALRPGERAKGRRLNQAGPVCSPSPRFVEWCLSNYLRQDLREEGFWVHIHHRAGFLGSWQWIPKVYKVLPMPPNRDLSSRAPSARLTPSFPASH